MVEARKVERMRHFADQPANRVARQLGIGIQRDDIADARRSKGQRLADPDEIRIGCAAQEAVQLVELAPLALPADPAGLTLVPYPPAMEQQEPRSPRRRAVALIKARHALGCRREKDIV